MSTTYAAGCLSGSGQSDPSAYTNPTPASRTGIRNHLQDCSLSLAGASMAIESSGNAVCPTFSPPQRRSSDVDTAYFLALIKKYPFGFLGFEASNAEDTVESSLSSKMSCRMQVKAATVKMSETQRMPFAGRSSFSRELKFCFCPSISRRFSGSRRPRNARSAASLALSQICSPSSTWTASAAAQDPIPCR